MMLLEDFEMTGYRADGDRLHGTRTTDERREVVTSPGLG
jgi:hypothetical protein